MIKNKFLFFSVMVLLVFCTLISSVEAVEIHIVADVKPIILVDFNPEEDPQGVFINLDNTYIKSKTDAFTEYPVVVSSPDNLSFTFNSTDALQNGEYTFYLEALDYVGNVGSYQVKFTVNIVDMGVDLNFPRGRIDEEGVIRGFTPTSPFDLLLSTERNATCKFSYTLLNFDFMTNLTKLSKDNKLHSYLDYEIPEGSTHTLFVKCQDFFGGITNKKIILKHDSRKPVLTSDSKAYPNLVIDTPLETTFKMFANNDQDIICKYSDDNETEYSLMETPFDTHDRSSFEAFQNPAETIVSGLNNKQTYEKYVICEALNGLLSDRYTVNFKVDLSAGIGPDLISPPEFTMESNVFVNLSTDKRATCSMTFEDETHVLSLPESPQNSHTFKIDNLDDGEYALNFVCYAADQKVDYSETFVVDTTPPIMDSIEHANKTSNFKELTASFKANDSQSPINEFIFKIVDQYNANIVNETIVKVDDQTNNAEQETTVEDLNLTDFTTYYFVAKANNSAGMVSNELKSKGILVDITYEQSTCNNGMFDSGESDIDCGGLECTRCINGKACNFNTDCISNYCENSVCADNTCADGNLSEFQGETDIDCGGDICSKCGLGSICKIDSDCNSNYCGRESFVCEDANCQDNVTNQDESDTDCGGNVCDKCEIGKSCGDNDDCISGFCDPMNFLCAAASCEDSAQNQDETDIDCGGSACIPCENGMSCKVDEDCFSNFCGRGNKCSEPSEIKTPAVVEEKSNLGLILLILFLLLLIGGGGGYYYYNYYYRPKAGLPAKKLSWNDIVEYIKAFFNGIKEMFTNPETFKQVMKNPGTFKTIVRKELPADLLMRQATRSSASAGIGISSPQTKQGIQLMRTTPPPISEKKKKEHKLFIESRKKKKASRSKMFEKFGEIKAKHKKEEEKKKALEEGLYTKHGLPLRKKIRKELIKKGRIKPKKVEFGKSKKQEKSKEKHKETVPTAADIYKKVKEPEKPKPKPKIKTGFEKLTKVIKKEDSFEKLSKLKKKKSVKKPNKTVFEKLPSKKLSHQQVSESLTRLGKKKKKTSLEKLSKLKKRGKSKK